MRNDRKQDRATCATPWVSVPKSGCWNRAVADALDKNRNVMLLSVCPIKRGPNAGEWTLSVATAGAIPGDAPGTGNSYFVERHRFHRDARITADHHVRGFRGGRYRRA